MFEEQEYKGYWWLPEQPERRVPGQLVLRSYDKAYIELQGDLQQDKSWRDDFDPPILLGISSNGKRITLEKCLLTNRTDNFAGFTILRFFVHKVYVGVHFESQDDIKFKGIFARYVNLDDWANYRSFQVERESDPSRITIRYERPAPIAIEIEDYDIAVVAGYSMKNGKSEVSLAEKATIRISSRTSEKRIDDFTMMVRKFQDLLGLAMGAPTFPVEVIGQTEASKRELKTGREVYNNIEVFYPAIGWMNEPKEVNWFEMLFTLPDIQEELASLISNWLEKGNELTPVFDLYFSVLYNPHLYTESTFESHAGNRNISSKKIWGQISG